MTLLLVPATHRRQSDGYIWERIDAMAEDARPSKVVVIKGSNTEEVARQWCSGRGVPLILLECGAPLTSGETESVLLGYGQEGDYIISWPPAPKQKKPTRKRQ